MGPDKWAFNVSDIVIHHLHDSFAPLSPSSEPAREEPEGRVTRIGDTRQHPEKVGRWQSWDGGEWVDLPVEAEDDTASGPANYCPPTPTPALCAHCGEQEPIGKREWSPHSDLCADCATVEVGRLDGNEPYANSVDAHDHQGEPRPRVRPNPLCAPIIWGGPVIE